MQTVDYTHAPSGATPSQPNNSGLFLITVLMLGAFMLYAVQNHLITEFFSYCMNYLFDSFSLKSSSIAADIILLIAFSLMLFGLFCLFKFFFIATVATIIIAAIAWAFSNTDTLNAIDLTTPAKHEQVVGGAK